MFLLQEMLPPELHVADWTKKFSCGVFQELLMFRVLFCLMYGILLSLKLWFMNLWAWSLFFRYHVLGKEPYDKRNFIPLCFPLCVFYYDTTDHFMLRNCNNFTWVNQLIFVESNYRSSSSLLIGSYNTSSQRTS